MAEREILGEERSRQRNSKCESPEVGTRLARREASMAAADERQGE